MKLMHTSDWHLGLDFYGQDMIADQRHMIKSIVRIAKEEKVDAVLLAGDVFDRAVVGAQAIELYDEAMQALCLEAGVKVLLCAGNHDGAARLSSLSELLKSAGLHIAGRVQAQEETMEMGDVVIHLLPYVTTDDARIAYPEVRECIGNAAQALQTVLKMRAPEKDGKKHILVAHCFAAGGKTGQSDRAAAVGGALAAPAEWFEGYDYVALGHLHRAQTLAGGKVRYSGTPLCTSFAEADQDKTVTILDTDDMSFYERKITPLHAVREKTGTLEELLKEPSEDYLHITVTDEYATALVQEQLRAVCPNALLIESARRNELGQATEMTMQEVTGSTPLEIAERFFMFKTGMEMDEEQRIWFQRAIEEAEKTEEV